MQTLDPDLDFRRRPGPGPGLGLRFGAGCEMDKVILAVGMVAWLALDCGRECSVWIGRRWRLPPAARDWHLLRRMPTPSPSMRRTLDSLVEP